MGILGNVLWFIFGGAIGGLSWCLTGCLWCITVIGIPVGLQCFKLASLSFFPFGKEVRYGGGAGSFLLNVIWLLVSVSSSFSWQSWLSCPLGQRGSSCDQTGTEKAVRLPAGVRFHTYSGGGSRTAFYIWQDPAMQKLHGCGHEYIDAGADGKV